MDHFLSKRIAFFFVLIFLFSGCAKSQQPLFRIVENGLIGYMNAAGEVVIPARFKEGSDFSEGLAAARVAGRYGYINEKGDFVIQPQYDAAGDFDNGIAYAYLDGQCFLIDQNGKQFLDTVFKSFRFISPGLAIVRTASEKKGIIDLKSNKLIADTVYGIIDDFDKGVARVCLKKTKPAAANEPKAGFAVIDTKGNYVVPPGKFQFIDRYENGLANVRLESSDSGSVQGFIDTKGNLIFKRFFPTGNYPTNEFQDGLLIVHLNKNLPGAPYSDQSYSGYMNLKGEIVLDDPLIYSLTKFSNGRAFARDRDYEYRIIDRKFKQVGKKTFDQIYEPGFVGGYAVVEKDGEWNVIDTNGNYLFKKGFEEFAGGGIRDGYLLYATDKNQQTFYGIADLKNRTFTQPIIQEYDEQCFKDGLLKTIVNDRLTYFNKALKIVWQEKTDSSKESPSLDIDYMNISDYPVSSKPDPNDIRGHYSTSNQPKEITGGQFPSGRLSVTVDTSRLVVRESQIQQQRYAAYSVYISNLSGQVVKMDAQDSRIYLKVQAKNSKGEWKDIEFTLSSWCGNSYHTVTLEGNQYWELSTPAYSGEMKTSMRLALEYNDRNDKNDDSRKRKTITIYSNEYRGSVNPGQFWNERSYTPQGIMDPYGSF